MGLTISADNGQEAQLLLHSKHPVLRRVGHVGRWVGRHEIAIVVEVAQAVALPLQLVEEAGDLRRIALKVQLDGHGDPVAVAASRRRAGRG
jgi:hypothetical protein